MKHFLKSNTKKLTFLKLCVMIISVMIMNYNVLFPTILDCGHFKCLGDNDYLCPPRVVRDYELDYNISGNRTMVLDGKKYDIKPNTVVFRYPGQKVQSTPNFDMYTLTLQLTGTKKPQKNIRQAANGEIQSTAKNDFFNLMPPYFAPKHYSEIANDYVKIIKTYSFSSHEQRKECLASLEHMLYLLFADAITEKVGIINLDTTWVEMAITYMEDNYQNSALRLKDIAAAVNMSESYLVRLFKSETGFTPKDYLNLIRMRQAKWHITYTNEPIYTISYLCGFDNPQYFISKFKSAFGKTPRSYRKTEIINQTIE